LSVPIRKETGRPWLRELYSSRPLQLPALGSSVVEPAGEVDHGDLAEGGLGAAAHLEVLVFHPAVGGLKGLVGGRGPGEGGQGRKDADDGENLSDHGRLTLLAAHRLGAGHGNSGTRSRAA
jgi:hypothetical protein